MAESSSAPGIARFGVFEFEPAPGELRKQGAKVRLQEQPAKILEILLRNSGSVVTREELREALWPADTYVDFDHSLNTAVRKLRTALDDSADTPRYVETLAKRGYRLVVPVEWIGPESATPPSGATAALREPWPASAPTASVRSRWRQVVLIVGAGAALAALIAWAMLRPSSAQPMHRAIAVLPIENPDPATRYVSDGIAEAIIDGLSTSPAIRVTSRTSSFHYRKPPLDPRSVGRELGVTAVVTGRFARQGDECHLRLELVDTQDLAQLWAKDYTQDSSALDTLRSRAVSDLSLRLGVSVSDRPQAVRNAEAYDFYLRGRYHWNLRKQEEQFRAVEYFRHAVELDPEFAPAWAGLASVYGTLVGSSLVPGSEEQTQRLSIEAANRAIALDDGNAEAWASIAASRLSYHFDFAGAERDFKRAISLNPSLSGAHQWYSALLIKVGRTDEALREADIAWELDPYSGPANASRCSSRLLARRYDESISMARQSQQRDPDMQLPQCLIWAHLLKGEVDGAREAASRKFPESAAELETAVEEGGMNGFVRAMSKIVPERLMYERAACHAMLGERDIAFALLERAVLLNRANITNLWVDPRFDAIRDDPRFLDLALRVGLPQAKAATRGNGAPPSPTTR